MDIHFKKSTTLGTKIYVSTEAGPSSSEALPPTAPVPTPPPYTVADLQQGLGSSNTGIVGGTTPAADAEVLRNILDSIKENERRAFCYLFLFCLPLLPLTILMMPIFCIVYAQSISSRKRVAMGGIRYMIRLEGDQWSRYVEHIYSESPRRMKRSAPQRLLARGYGHILFGPQGFFLDALLGMEYKNITAVRTEVIRAPNGIDMMLRAWFCKRLVVVRVRDNSNVKVNNDPFKFDIFLPPNMPTEVLSSLSDFITLGSTCQPVSTQYAVST
jgi:hypothetical protein